MLIQLVRENMSGLATEGKLFVNGTFECFSLEDTDRLLEVGGKKIYGQTAIPRGVYDMDITYSNRFKQDMPIILNVPQFEGIRIHKGNTSLDTDGCILVGISNEKKDDNFIGGSKIAYNRLFLKLVEAKERGEKLTIEIV